MIVRLVAGIALIRGAISERCCGITEDGDNDWYVYTKDDNNNDILWEGTDEVNLYCNEYNPDTDISVHCACLNSGVFPEFNDAIVWDTDFSVDMFSEILNGEKPYPNCVELEQIYWEDKLNQLSTDEYLQSEEYQLQDQELKREYAQKLRARNEKRAERRRLRQENRKAVIGERSLQLEQAQNEVCDQDDNACRERQIRNEHRRHMINACKDLNLERWTELEEYNNGQFAGRHCCVEGKFIINGKMFMDKSKDGDKITPAACVWGSIKRFNQHNAQSCRNSQNKFISEIKEHNNNLNEGQIVIIDNNAKHARDIYRFDDDTGRIIKYALTLTCPEGYHFQDNESRIYDWACDGTEDTSTSLEVECQPNAETAQQSQAANALNAVLSTMSADISEETFMEFLAKTDSNLYNELKDIDPTSNEDEEYEARILGGQRVPTSDDPMYPWQVFMDMGNKGFCGGVVVTDRVFFTAAHCIKSGGLHDRNERSKVTVHVGITHKNEIDRENDSNTYYLLECTVHAQYRIASQIMQNDIAYCIVNKPFDFESGKVAPACLPQESQRNYRNENCYATGFGTISEGAMSGSTELLAVKVGIKSMLECVGPYNNEVKSDYHICAGGDRGKDSCQGDSGGPFVCEIPEEEVEEGSYYDRFCRYSAGDGSGNKVVKVLSGIISFGKGCGRQGVPGVYVNVWNEPYRQFIGATVNATTRNPYLGGPGNNAALEDVPSYHPWMREFGDDEFPEQVLKEEGYNDKGYYETPKSEQYAKYLKMIEMYRRIMAQQAEARRQQQLAAQQAAAARQRPSYYAAASSGSSSNNRRPSSSSKPSKCDPRTDPRRCRKVKKKKRTRWGRSVKPVQNGPPTMK